MMTTNPQSIGCHHCKRNAEYVRTAPNGTHFYKCEGKHYSQVAPTSPPPPPTQAPTPPPQAPTFDLQRSESERDKGLRKVNREGFSSRLSAFVANRMTDTADFTGEDIRRLATEADIHPHSPKAWGGVIGGLVRSGVIEPTGERRKMTDVRSHGRKTDVYRLTPRGDR